MQNCRNKKFRPTAQETMERLRKHVVFQEHVYDKSTPAKYMEQLRSHIGMDRGFPYLTTPTDSPYTTPIKVELIKHRVLQAIATIRHYAETNYRQYCINFRRRLDRKQENDYNRIEIKVLTKLCENLNVK